MKRARAGYNIPCRHLVRAQRSFFFYSTTFTVELARSHRIQCRANEDIWEVFAWCSSGNIDQFGSHHHHRRRISLPPFRPPVPSTPRQSSSRRTFADSGVSRPKLLENVWCFRRFGTNAASGYPHHNSCRVVNMGSDHQLGIREQNPRLHNRRCHARCDRRGPRLLS